MRVTLSGGQSAVVTSDREFIQFSIVGCRAAVINTTSNSLDIDLSLLFMKLPAGI